MTSVAAVLVATSAGIAGALPANAASPAAPTPTIGFAGYAYGTYVDTQAGTVVSGPHANTSIKPNTVIKVAGLGTVTLHKVSRTATAPTVTMMEIKLSQKIGTLPTGTTIVVGYSSSGVLSAL